jgi:uracil-DNA glycosylase family 4
VSEAALASINAEIIDCVRCPRLVAWRAAAAASPPARFARQQYWARPVPGFGDPRGRIMIVGLAPAAHGGNRTGRVFTGDRSGDFLFAALHEAGLASRAESIRRDDQLQLTDVYVTAVNRCAPPANRPTTQERDNCLPYLAAEIQALDRLRVCVCLGAYAWAGCLLALAALGEEVRPRPRFGHGSEARVARHVLLGSFHPSQQNTFTGRLTKSMLDDVLTRAVGLASTIV